MGHGARRWLVGLGAAAVVGASVVGQAGGASAWTTGARLVSGVASKVQPGSVYTPTSQILTLGMRGAAVKRLQQRLNFLHYYAGKANGFFSWSTMEAVWAFKEVQSGKRIPPRHDIVGPHMQAQLTHPRLPKVLKPHGGPWRIEVNKNIEVLVLYRHNKVRLISHVSTAAYCRPDGCGWVTPDGTHRALWFAAGWVGGSLGLMFNPVVFTPDGAYAIHGEPDPSAAIGFDGVPLNPASHGCVRIPMDIAEFFHNLVHTGANGTPIYIFGRNN